MRKEKIVKLFKEESKLDNFNELLDSITTVDDKQKSLWKEIFENAITDRNRAQMLFDNLVQDVTGSHANHSIHSISLSKYLERMEKSNAQIIKLAEMISEVKKDDSEMSQNDIFDKIQGKK